MDSVTVDADGLPPVDPLRRGTDLFTTRKQDVFACLGELEKKHTAFLDTAAADGLMKEAGLIKGDPEDDTDVGKEEERDRIERGASRGQRHRSGLGDTRHSDYKQRSGDRRRGHGVPPHQRGDADTHSKIHSYSPNPNFRRPYARAPLKGRHQTMPDFRKHPERYTHYSLGDVSEQQMSETSNASAAFAFLDERKMIREREERKAPGLSGDEEEGVKFDTDSAACSQGLFTFSRPSRKQDPSGDERRSKDATISDKYSSSVIDSDDVVAPVGETTLVDSESCDPVKSDDSSFKSRKKGSNRRNIRRKGDGDSD